VPCSSNFRQSFAGQRVNAAASLVDWWPTLLEALGQTPPPPFRGPFAPSSDWKPASLEAVPRSPPATTLERSCRVRHLFPAHRQPALRARAIARALRSGFRSWREEKHLSTKPPRRCPPCGELDSFVKRVSTGHLRLCRTASTKRAGRSFPALGYMASGKNSPSTRMTPRPHRCRPMYARCQLGHRRGKGATSIRCCSRLWPRPANSGSPYYLGIAYVAAGQLAKAIPPLRKAIELRRMH